MTLRHCLFQKRTSQFIIGSNAHFEYSVPWLTQSTQTSNVMSLSSPRSHMPTVLDLTGHAGEHGAICGSSGLNNFTEKTS